ncbi:MAG: alpha/beta fold hydrolase, partial [Rhodobacteraceae bacterium]|nr:alpha/beta fold hydrolase [Paracoccaceae bacterium]
MPIEVIMPKVDMDMTAGRIVRWHVAEGAEVEKDAALFDIETDKAAMEVESPAAGRIHHIRAAAGQEIAVGEPVAWLYAEDETLGPAPGEPPADESGSDLSSSVAPSAAEPNPTSRRSAPDSPPADRPLAEAVRASPLARRLAREGGLDLRTVSGTSLNGRISRVDIEAALAADSSRPPRAAPPSRAADAGLSVTRAGGGDSAPFLLIHGFAADSTGWTRLEASLPAGREVVRLDLPGHGRSPRLKVVGFPDLAQAARQAFDALGDGPFHLVGHSLGGAVALALADTRARRVASLTLIAPAGLGPDIDGATIAGMT